MLHLNTNKFLNAGQGLPNRGAAKGTFHMPCNGLSSIKEVLLRVWLPPLDRGIPRSSSADVIIVGLQHGHHFGPAEFVGNFLVPGKHFAQPRS
jgi:hypothetical protein